MLDREDPTPTTEYRRPGLLLSVIAALTILPAGFNLALPGVVEGVTWTVPYEVFHGVFIHNVLTFGLMAAALVKVLTRRLKPVITTEAAWFAALIGLLAITGALSTLFNSSRYSTMGDLGEIGRLGVSAFYFLVVSHWAGIYGPMFIMRWFLAGIAAGGLINVYYSITIPYNVIGVLPFLYSRNGGGGILALGICLSAWMWPKASRGTLVDRWVIVSTAVVGLVAVTMSYSKTSMAIGATGLIAWLVTLGGSPWAALQRSRLGKALLLVVIVGVVLTPAGSISDVWASLNMSISNKFLLVLTPEVNGSVRDRLSYYLAVWQILTAHPINFLIGVSFSGFYPTVIETPAYAQGLVEEELGAGRLANPHNSYLHYLAALGVTGFLVVAAIYWTFVRAVFDSIEHRGFRAYAIAGAIGVAYVFYGGALPSLFKTEVLYLPAAAAMASARRFTS